MQRLLLGALLAAGVTAAQAQEARAQETVVKIGMARSVSNGA